MADSIEKIITTWKAVHLGGSVPIREARREPMLLLYATFAEHGYTEEECSTQRVKSMVMGASIPHNCKPKKRPGWERAVVKDIEIAIATQWPSKMAENHKPINLPKKTENKPDIKQEPKEDSVESEEPFVRVSREPDPKWLAAQPQPEVEYDDEEFFKLLRGVK